MSPLNFEFLLDTGLTHALVVPLLLSSLLAPICVRAGWQPLSLKSDCHLTSSEDDPLVKHVPAAPMEKIARR